jgi:uncharacterized protein (TIGR02001 family)
VARLTLVLRWRGPRLRVTVPAGLIASQARGSPNSRSRHFGIALTAGAILASASPANAQVGTAISLFSDYRFRGYSLSDSRPAAILDLSYDASTGFYAGASGSIAFAKEGIKPLGLQVNSGYARQLRSGLTLDAGVIHSTYSHYSGVNTDRSYTEMYVGLAGKWLFTRVAVSPDYFGAGVTGHGEVGAQFALTKSLRATANVGLLVPLSHADYRQISKPQYDLRLGLDQTLGKVTLHAAVTSRGDDHAAYGARRSSRNAFIVGVSVAP